MHANYTDAAGTVIGSSSSSSAISIQLAPSAPTGLRLFETPTNTTFTVDWNNAIDPDPISGYSLSYEFKKDGSSISYTPTIYLSLTPQIVLNSISTPPADGTTGTIGIYNDTYYISAIVTNRVWAIMRVEQSAVYNNSVVYNAGDIVTYSGSIYAMKESVGGAGYIPSTRYWIQLSTREVCKATFSNLDSGSFISALNVYAKYKKSGATDVLSASSNTISVQLAPPAPIISTLTGSTLTNTGFSIQWNNITVPASSPYTLSYTFSGTYDGLTAGTRTIGAAVTTWPFTVTSLGNGGTVTNLSITATYTSGSSILSAISNTISSVTIPGLPPVITSFTVTQGDPLTTSPWWPPLVYTWTLSGGTPTSYYLKTPGVGYGGGSTSFSETRLTSATSPYSATYSEPIPTYNTSSRGWLPNSFEPYLSVTKGLDTSFYTAPVYYYPPGRVTFTMVAAAGNNDLCNVYIQSCRFAMRYDLSVAAGGVLPSPLRTITHQQLLDTTDSLYTSTSPWRLLGTIPKTPGRYFVIVFNQTNSKSKWIELNISEIGGTTEWPTCRITMIFGTNIQLDRWPFSFKKSGRTLPGFVYTY
jgi:hypothetical protein